MLTVHEVSELTGISIRTLHYYDEIGLLKPSAVTEAGYRLYDDGNLERLQQIMLFRELDFPLRDIKKILDYAGFDRDKALCQQIDLLTLKKERIERLISLAKQIRTNGGRSNMSFEEFDREKLNAYTAEAKKTWGHTEAWQEYEKHAAGRTAEKQQSLAEGLMRYFVLFGELKEGEPSDERAQTLVKELQAYITANYYTCTDQILRGLGQMYAAGGEMTGNIDRAGGKGTAAFAAKAIAIYCN